MGKTNRYKTFYYIFITILSISILGGCKSKQSIVSSKGDRVISKSINRIIEDALRAELKFKTLKIKTSLEFHSKKSKVKTNCQIRIIKDKSIDISVRIPIINAEAAKVIFTPDSVFFIDRMHKKYLAENVAELLEENYLPFNFYNLQDLLTNKFFIPGKKQVKRKDYKTLRIVKEDNFFEVETPATENILGNFKIGTNDRVNSVMLYYIPRNIATLWDYSEFIQNKESLYPTKINVKISSKQKDANFTFIYTNIDIDKEFSIDNKISNKYKRSSVIDLLRSYLK